MELIVCFGPCIYGESLPVYSCNVNEIILNDPNSDTIKITGEHLENMTNDDVVGVFFDEFKDLEKFPRGLGKVFEDLIYLEIAISSIATLNKDDFDDLGDLQGFWLTDSRLVTLPGNLFDDVRAIRDLSFARNKLKYIGQDIMNPLKMLKYANFEGNTNINMVVYEGGGEKLETLKHAIATNCYPPSPSTKTTHEPNNVIELEERVKVLEAKIKNLEDEKALQEGKRIQLAGITQMMEIMQARLEALENN